MKITFLLNVAAQNGGARVVERGDQIRRDHIGVIDRDLAVFGQQHHDLTKPGKYEFIYCYSLEGLDSQFTADNLRMLSKKENKSYNKRNCCNNRTLNKHNCLNMIQYYCNKGTVKKKNQIKQLYNNVHGNITRAGDVMAANDNV